MEQNLGEFELKMLENKLKALEKREKIATKNNRNRKRKRK